MRRIHILTKIGLVMLAMTLAAWFLMSQWVSRASLAPISVPLQTSAGAHFSKTLEIGGSEYYQVDVVCLAVGPLESKGERDIEKQYKRIACDMYITLTEEGETIFKRRVGFLDRAVLWQDTVTFYLLDMDIEKSGRYELSIDNIADLSFLDPTEPRLEVRVNSSSLETAEVIRALLPYYCLRIGIVALILIATGLVLASRRDRRSPTHTR